MVLNKTLTEQMADAIKEYKSEMDGLISRLQEIEIENELLKQKVEEFENIDLKEIDLYSGTLRYEASNLLLLEVMEELTRVLQAGKSRTVINCLKSL